MIYATVKPLEDYNVTVRGETVGLYDSYGHIPALLALIMIGSVVPYHYEDPTYPKGELIVGFTNIDVWKDTLKCEVRGETIEALLERLNPLEFHDHIKDSNLSHLPLISSLLGGDEEVFKGAVMARAGAWALNYRGKVETAGNVTKVCFGGLNSGISVSEEIALRHTVYKEHLKYVKK